MLKDGLLETEHSIVAEPALIAVTIPVCNPTVAIEGDNEVNVSKSLLTALIPDTLLYFPTTFKVALQPTLKSTSASITPIPVQVSNASAPMVVSDQIA